jgi:hypothetical protein
MDLLELAAATGLRHTRCDEAFAPALRRWLDDHLAGPLPGGRALLFVPLAQGGFVVCDDAFLVDAVPISFADYSGHTRQGGTVSLRAGARVHHVRPADPDALVTFLTALERERPSPAAPIPGPATALRWPEPPDATRADAAATVRTWWVHGRPLHEGGVCTILPPDAFAGHLARALGAKPSVTRGPGGEQVLEVQLGSHLAAGASKLVAHGMASAMAAVVGVGVGFGPRTRKVQRLRFTVRERPWGSAVVAEERAVSWVPLARGSPKLARQLREGLWEAERGWLGLAPGAAPEPAVALPVVAPARRPPAPPNPTAALSTTHLAAFAVALPGTMSSFFVTNVGAGLVLLALGDPRRVHLTTKVLGGVLSLVVLMAPLQALLLAVGSAGLAAVHSASGPGWRTTRGRTLSLAWMGLSVASVVFGNPFGLLAAGLVGLGWWSTRGAKVPS